MKNKIIYFFTLSFIVIQVSFGQTYAADEGDTGSVEPAKLKGISQGVYTSLFNTAQSRASEVQGRSVILSQIGDDNTTKIAVSAQSSDIRIKQNGNDNDVNLTYQAKSVFTDLKQNGNNNFISDYAINPDQDISLDLQQNGSNLNFERFGTNELSKNIKFTQSAASPTIIIRSFK